MSEAASHPGYAALHEDVAVVDPRREVVRASGPDALVFLQGQLSQDLRGIPEGASAWSWLLQPAGKVEALLRVSHLPGGDWLLDTDRGFGPQVAARLNRFRLRTKIDIELMDGWTVVGLRGPGARAAAAAAGQQPSPEGAVALLDADWPGLDGVDLVGPAPAAPADLLVADPAEWQAARIEAGIPVMGAELTERTIPAETGLIDRTVSFTKGCYTGQELVARIDSRGSNVPRSLRGFVLDGPVEKGTAVRSDEGAEVGTVTSVAWSPVRGWIALGYVRRGFEVGASVTADSGAAVVASLPLHQPGAEAGG